MSVHLKNAPTQVSMSLPGNMTLFSDEHPSNAKSPIEVIPAGKVMLFNSVAPEKALGPIATISYMMLSCLTFAGISTVPLISGAVLSEMLPL